MAIRIFNDCSNEYHVVNWQDFQFLCDIHDIEDIKEFYEYICVIRETVANFDDIYDNKTNTDEVKATKAFIQTIKKK